MYCLQQLNLKCYFKSPENPEMLVVSSITYFANQTGTFLDKNTKSAHLTNTVSWCSHTRHVARDVCRGRCRASRLLYSKSIVLCWTRPGGLCCLRSFPLGPHFNAPWVLFNILLWISCCSSLCSQQGASSELQHTNTPIHECIRF